MTDAEHLSQLEAEFPNTPPALRRADLQEINDLRHALGMPMVSADHYLTRSPAATKMVTKVKKTRDHTRARVLYQRFLDREAELAPHRAYADRVARATGGPGMTPVEPLATMGCGGGPLLCDVCDKPMILEGGIWNKVYADAAWRRNTDKQPGWKSWISGGMVVEIAVNGTLRIYHGYPGRSPDHCCNIASAELAAAEAKHGPGMPSDVRTELWHFLAEELPGKTDAERSRLIGEIGTTLFDYDPGIGVNRPEDRSCQTPNEG